jgi:hypothetical protein
MIDRARQALLPYKDWLSWGSTAILIVGVGLSSINVYPYFMWFSLAGNLMWALMGWMWKENSLIVVSLLMVAIYIAGFMKLLLPI